MQVQHWEHHEVLPPLLAQPPPPTPGSAPAGTPAPAGITPSVRPRRRETLAPFSGVPPKQLSDYNMPGSAWGSTFTPRTALSCRLVPTPPKFSPAAPLQPPPPTPAKVELLAEAKPPADPPRPPAFAERAKEEPQQQQPPPQQQQQQPPPPPQQPSQQQPQPQPQQQQQLLAEVEALRDENEMLRARLAAQGLAMAEAVRRPASRPPPHSRRGAH